VGGAVMETFLYDKSLLWNFKVNSKIQYIGLNFILQQFFPKFVQDDLNRG
jgi:hypothetical protein